MNWLAAESVTALIRSKLEAELKACGFHVRLTINLITQNGLT